MLGRTLAIPFAAANIPVLMLAVWIILAFLALIAAGFASRALLAGPRAEVDVGLTWYLLRIYAALVHRVRINGLENLPRAHRPGPLIVVCNHTAGVDPVLVQAVSSFEIRWMMAQDMRMQALESFWQFARIIFVDRHNRDLTGTREAIRHVKAGGVLGIFPEGGLERPARTILPFQPGVGMIIRRTGAPVLPVVITGTPVADRAWESLLRRSRAQVTVHAPLTYPGPEWSAEKIAADLRQRYCSWTGWPPNERVPWDASE